eukprot:3123513-Amphidinium_carterae.2
MGLLSDLSRLAGRLDFARSFVVASHVLNPVVADLHWMTKNMIGKPALCDVMVALLSNGAVEGDFAGGGAVLDLHGVVRVLQFDLDGAALDSLREQGFLHAIAQMELLRVLVAKEMKGADVLHFTNTSQLIKQCLVNGTSEENKDRVVKLLLLVTHTTRDHNLVVMSLCDCVLIIALVSVRACVWFGRKIVQ